MISAIDFSSSGVALLAGGLGRAITFRELGQWVAEDRVLLRSVGRPGLAFMFGPSGASAIAAYLACLEEKLPLGLGEPSATLSARVIDAYRPSMLILPRTEPVRSGYTLVGSLAGGDWVLLQADEGAYPVVPHADLALLLATSGSTGDPKLVRLSLRNLETNARSIVKYLGIGPGEIAVQSLPLHYSYGLSVLNSHLVGGAAIALTDHSFMRPEFWGLAEEFGCTSFAGVPYMYETLHRLRLSPFGRAQIRTATQAGGHLRVDLVREVHESAFKKGGRYFVMYGQTEATARMSYVPPDRLGEKAGSIGISIPGGELHLEPVDGESAFQQLHYRGPNVMLGYANTPGDLERGDELNGDLSTGDLAERDADGFFRICGRLARFAKLFGKRVDLISVETEIEREFFQRTAVLDGGNRLRVFLEGNAGSVDAEIRKHLSALLGVPPAVIGISFVHQLPLTSSGKKDYKALV